MTDRTINIIDPATGEEVNVDGHPMASRDIVPVEELTELPDDRLKHEYGDVGEPAAKLPVLLSRNFTTDPVEGEQGSFTQIVEEDCPKCGYDRADHTSHTLGGVHNVVCRACGYQIETC